MDDSELSIGIVLMAVLFIIMLALCFLQFYRNTDQIDRNPQDTSLCSKDRNSENLRENARRHFPNRNQRLAVSRNVRQHHRRTSTTNNSNNKVSLLPFYNGQLLHYGGRDDHQYHRQKINLLNVNSIPVSLDHDYFYNFAPIFPDENESDEEEGSFSSNVAHDSMTSCANFNIFQQKNIPPVAHHVELSTIEEESRVILEDD